MAIDIPKWMKEDMGFSDEEQKVIGPLLTPERADKIEKSMLRQQDYSKQMDALTKAQTDLSTANERLNGEIAAWAQTQAEGGELTKKQQEALDKAEATQLRLTQVVRSLAVAAGQDPEEALKGITVETKPTTPTTPTTPAIDPDAYLPRDAGARLAALSLALATTVPAIAHEHFVLTGETLDTEAIGREIINRINTQGNKKTPRKIITYWINMAMDAKAATR